MIGFFADHFDIYYSSPSSLSSTLLCTSKVEHHLLFTNSIVKNIYFFVRRFLRTNPPSHIAAKKILSQAPPGAAPRGGPHGPQHPAYPAVPFKGKGNRGSIKGQAYNVAVELSAPGRQEDTERRKAPPVHDPVRKSIRVDMPIIRDDNCTLNFAPAESSAPSAAGAAGGGGGPASAGERHKKHSAYKMTGPFPPGTTAVGAVQNWGTGVSAGALLVEDGVEGAPTAPPAPPALPSAAPPVVGAPRGQEVKQEPGLLGGLTAGGIGTTDRRTASTSSSVGGSAASAGNSTKPFVQPPGMFEQPLNSAKLPGPPPQHPPPLSLPLNSSNSTGGDYYGAGTTTTRTTPRGTNKTGSRTPKTPKYPTTSAFSAAVGSAAPVPATLPGLPHTYVPSGRHRTTGGPYNNSDAVNYYPQTPAQVARNKKLLQKTQEAKQKLQAEGGGGSCKSFLEKHHGGNSNP